MTISYKARRRLSLVILLVGLPVYAVASITLIAQFDRPSILFELFVYLGLGVIWALPFKHIFKGVGQADLNEK
jgi:hypothetical protein